MGLQIRRGLSSQMTSSVTPEEGEPIYTLDDNKLYIGDGNTTANNLTAVNEVDTTTELTDVSSVAPTNNTFLVYNSTNSQYESTALSLASLPEVHSVPSVADQVLAYDNNPSNPSYGKLAPLTLGLSVLSDVDVISPSNGDTLVYNSTTGVFENSAGGGGGGSSTFTGLTDTPSTLGTAGQLVAVNSAGTALEFVAASSGGSSTLASLTDVSLTSPVADDMLIYDGVTSQFINVPYSLTSIGDFAGLLVNAANDTAAATAGVFVGQVYRNGSVLQIRVT